MGLLKNIVSSGKKPGKKLNVIMLLIDGARADHLGRFEKFDALHR